MIKPHAIPRNATRIGLAALVAASLGAGLALTSCSGTQSGSSATPAPAEQKADVPVQLEELTLGTEYSDFDVTGDGTADKLLINAEEDKSGFIKDVMVTVNGKEALCLDGSPNEIFYYTVGANYVQAANGVSYLELACMGDNDAMVMDGLYLYKDGTFSQVLDYTNFIDQKFGTHQAAEIANIEGTTLSLRYSLMSYILGYGFACTYDYTVGDDGALTQTSKETDKVNYIAEMKECNQESNVYFKLNKGVSGYDKPGNSGTATKLKAGSQLTPKGAYVDEGDLYVRFQEKESGKDYWIHASESVEDPTLLDGVMYAG